MNEETTRRLSVTHNWATRHAKNSERPSRFLDHYESVVFKARHGHGEPDTLISYLDPVALAAEIEAYAAWRRVQRWYTGEGLLKIRMDPRSGADDGR